MNSLVRSVSALIVSSFLWGSEAVAQCVTCGDEVKVRFQGSLCINGTFTLTLNGKIANGSGSNCGAYSNSNQQEAKLKPGVPYNMVVTAPPTPGGGVNTVHLELDCPGCYDVYIDGIETKTVDITGINGCGSGGAYTRTFSVLVKGGGGGAGTAGEGSLGSGSPSGGVSGNISLGGLSNGDSAGEISLSSGAISPDLFTPAALNYSSVTPEVQIIRNPGSTLRQIKAPEILADIVVLSTTSYEVRIYPISQVGVLSGGVFQVSGNPARVWRFSSPTATASVPVLQVMDTAGTTTVTRIFDAATAGTWSLTNGDETELRESSTLPNGDISIDTTHSKPWSVASKVRDIYHAFPWGTEKVKSIADPDGAALTTEWTFHELLAETWSYGKKKWITYPDGSWERYEYYNVAAGGAQTSNGKLYRIYRPWLDAPALPANANFTNSHVTEYLYTGSGSHFLTDVSIQRVHVLGTLIRETDPVSFTSSEWMTYPVVVRQSGNSTVATFEQPANYSSSPPPTVPDFLRGLTAYTIEENGQKTEYFYEKGNYVPATQIFTPTANGNHIRTTVTRGNLVPGSPAVFTPVVGKHTRTIRIAASGGNILREEISVKTDTGYASLSLVLHTHDSLGRLTATTLSGRPTYDAFWDNGRLQSETDENGIVTTYGYDAQGRLVSESRNGVAKIRIYDAAGRTIESIRTTGALTLTSSSSYDIAGRMISATAEDGLVTTTTYPGPRTVSRTLPDTGTEISESYLDGQAKSVTGTGAVARYFSYGIEGSSLWSRESIGAPASLRYSQSWTDNKGRNFKSARTGPSGLIESITAYDPVIESRPISRTVPGEAKILYGYDPDTGEATIQARDRNPNNTIDLAGTDAVTTSTSGYVEINGIWYRETFTSRLEQDNNADPTVLSTTRDQITGLGAGISSIVQSQDSQGHSTTRTAHIDRPNRTLTVTTDTPDSDKDAQEIYIDGLIRSSRTTTVETPTLYNVYDPLERLTSVTSPGGVVTTTAYDPATGRVSSVTRAGKTTSYTYYPAGSLGAGRVATETQPDATVIRTAYTVRGEVFRVWGGATYPLEYSYDTYGQLQFLRTYRADAGWTAATWPASPGTADVTEWRYNVPSGLLHQKVDAAGRFVTYTYHSNGKLHIRTRARGGITSTYQWDDFGLQASVVHNDGTPGVTTVRDRTGRAVTITDAAGTRVFSYPNPLEVTETITGGTLDGVSRRLTLDTYSRPGEISVTSGVATHSTNYGYSGDSRLGNVNSGNFNAGYGYDANSDTVLNVSYYNSSFFTSLATYRGLDSENRLVSTDHYFANFGEVQSFGVQEFDAMDRRKKIARDDGTRWNYGYNSKGEVTSGVRELVNAPNTAVPGWNYLYQFDQIGNRDTATVNGRLSSYTSNPLNQIISRSVPRGFDVLGKASTTASVTVDGQPATRLYEYFHRPMTTGTGAVHVPYSVAATDANGTTTRSGGKFLPASPEASTYDFDGNLTSDGRFTYVWDAENRLVSMETHATVPVPARRKLAFAYDGGSRRIRKTVWHGNAGGTWDFKHEHRFVHELGGWNIQAELKADGSFLRTYVWGTDLSGNFSGAGGVGGLLFTNILADKTTHAHGYDLNGNVTLLVNAATGEATATYDYGPFGEPIRESGEYAKLNPYRFSTKYTDDETGLLDYGYRYYDPVSGRWLSTDPIGEQGGPNLFGINGNDNIGFFDILGLTPAAARGAIDTALTYYLDESVNSGLGDRTGFNDAFLKLLSLSGYSAMNIGDDTFSKFYQTVTKGRASSFYSKHFRIIYLNPGEKSGTILHEVIHAWNDLSGNPAAGTLDDEAMAYLGGNGVDAVVGNVFQLIKDIGRFSCEDLRSRNVVNARWGNGMWDTREDWSSPGWGTAVLGSASRPINKSDFVKLKDSVGFNFSCEAMADYINVLLWRKNCCMRVRCTSPLFRIDEDGYNSHGANKNVEIEY